MRRTTALIAALAVTLMAGCAASGTDYKKAAEKLISGDLSSQGFGKMTGACDAPPEKPKAGDTFNCTGTTADGKVAKFVATVQDGNKVELNSTNVLSTDDLRAIEQTAVAALEQQAGATLGAENFTCGNEAVIFDESGIVCALTDPSSGSVFDATVTISDLTDLSTLQVQVADTPRG